ncbi:MULTISPECIES: helix-turn-helix transcriptional regulator [Pseudomonadaceae]|uniref:HTH cro/C1-type domain-containing protein n=1 Tax=Pseudomonas abyssi TaxID=170540 RepID=A0A395R3M3_9PSED|nr:helix-turn-helix transcriptional regulator [Halopseudomonas gallaeciensis]RGP54399.1 hypothetical protein ASB58_10995 [Halopseudomonas gallaeciensis]
MHHLRVETGARLQEERNRLGLIQAEFADKIGVAKRTLAGYEGGSSDIGATVLDAAGRLGIDVLYVVTGARQAPAVESLSHEEAHLISRFRVLDDEGRGMIVRLVNDLASAAEKIGKALKAKD